MTDSRFTHLAVCALATWRVTSLLVDEDGPFDVFLNLREKAGVGHGDPFNPTFFGGLLGCFWCTSVWIGIVVALVAASPLRWLLVPFALSGAAILIEQVGAGDD